MDLHEALVLAKERVTERDRLKNQLTQHRQSLAEKQEAVEACKRQLAETEHDLKSLQGLSIRHLFHSLLGNERRLVDETEKEILQATLQLQSSESVAQLLAEDVLSLERRIQELGDVDKAYQAAFEAKERSLIDHDPKARTALANLAHREAEARSQLKEIGEASAAAEQARLSLEACMGSLSSAGDWGVADMLGGGMMTTMIKRDKMDMAAGYANQAEADLLRLKTELSDVYGNLAIAVDHLQSFSFADYFFDGLIVDWMVQGEIRQAEARISEALSTVMGVARELAEEQKATSAAVEEVAARHRAYIESDN